MIKIFFLSLLLSSSLLAATVGEMAPNFELEGSDGKVYKLSDLKGKVVVLEWYNAGCPYVKKHYNSSNMQSLQKKFKDKVVWFAVNSSAQGNQGHLSDPKTAKEKYKEQKMHAKAILLDGDGKVGQAYRAVTTPHMFVIDKNGKLAYNGAIDSNSSSDSADIETATPYASDAINAVISGSKVKRAKNRPYGCSVKY